jgi:hypothetical protein
MAEREGFALMGEHRNVLPSSTLEMPCQAFQEQGVGSSNGTPVRIPPAELKKEKTGRYYFRLFLFGGEGGIRTLAGTFAPLTI